MTSACDCRCQVVPSKQAINQDVCVWQNCSFGAAPAGDGAAAEGAVAGRRVHPRGRAASPSAATCTASSTTCCTSLSSTGCRPRRTPTSSMARTYAARGVLEIILASQNLLGRLSTLCVHPRLCKWRQAHRGIGWCPARKQERKHGLPGRMWEVLSGALFQLRFTAEETRQNLLACTSTQGHVVRRLTSCSAEALSSAGSQP